MGKIIKILIVLSLIIPSISLATSGACSWHEGVNCSAGATWDGKVKCNDGWVNSSVYFSDAVECQTKSFCVYPSYNSCDVEYAKQLAQGRIDSQRAINARGGLFQDLGDYTQDPDYLLCKHTQELHDIAIENYNRCLQDEIDRFSEEEKKFHEEFQKKLDEACAEGEEGSVWNDSLPLDTYGTKCTSPGMERDQKCQEKDEYSFYSEITKGCVCTSGYILNEKSICEKKIDATVPVVSAQIPPTTKFNFQPPIITPKKYKPSDTETTFKKPTPYTNENILNSGLPSYNNKNNGLPNYDDEINNMRIRLENNLTNETEEESVLKAPWYKKVFNWLFN